MKLFKTAVLTLALFCGTAQADQYLFVGNSLDGTDETARTAYEEALFASGVTSKKESFEGSKFIPARKAIATVKRTGLIWNDIYLGTGAKIHRTWSARVVEDWADYPDQITIDVASGSKSLYGMAFTANNGSFYGQLVVELDGIEVPIEDNDRKWYNGTQLQDIFIGVIDTEGFNNAVIRPLATDDHVFFSADQFHFAGPTSSVPYFNITPPDPVDEGDCPEGQEPVEEDDGTHCEDIE